MRFKEKLLITSACYFAAATPGAVLSQPTGIDPSTQSAAPGSQSATVSEDPGSSKAIPPLEPEGGAQYDYSRQLAPNGYENSMGGNYGVPQGPVDYGYSPYHYGSPMYPQQAPSAYGMPGSGYYQQAAPYAPQGLVIPISLQTAISTQVAKDGDYVQAKITRNVALQGASYIPAGSIVSGEIEEAEAGRRLSRSGSLDIKFDELRMRGEQIPIRAHLVGSIGRYKQGPEGEMRGEHFTAKLGQFALRGLLGAGLGAALGTGVGAIAGGGSGAGMGAWSGAAIGGGIGGLDMLLRKGRDVIIPSGTQMQLQLDQPLRIPVSPSPAAPPYSQPATGAI